MFHCRTAGQWYGQWFFPGRGCHMINEVFRDATQQPSNLFLLFSIVFPPFIKMYSIYLRNYYMQAFFVHYEIKSGSKKLRFFPKNSGLGQFSSKLRSKNVIFDSRYIQRLQKTLGPVKKLMVLDQLLIQRYSPGCSTKKACCMEGLLLFGAFRLCNILLKCVD